MTPSDILQICRLCLIEDEVNVEIFGEKGNSLNNQIFSKIKSCLPVSISKKDNLPKKICVECCSKLNSLHEFWKTTLNAEKQLNLWLAEIESNVTSKKPCHSTRSGSKEPINNNIRHFGSLDIKQETADSEDELWNKNKHFQSLQKFSNVNETENVSMSTTKMSNRNLKMKHIILSLNDNTYDENEDSKIEDSNNESSLNNHVLMYQQSSPNVSPIKDNSLLTIDNHNSNHLVPIIELSEGNWLNKEEMINPLAAEIHASFKKMGYKNPFVYPKLKNKRKSLKRLESKNNTKWQCMICSDVKLNKEELMEHYEIHKSETESIKGSKLLGDYFMCPVCLTDFTSLISYEKHVELNHGEKQFNCGMCNRAFKNLYSLSVHNHKRHSDKIFKCAACDFEYEQLKSLRDHIRSTHEEHIKYHCEVCNKGFSSFSWYQEHKNFHTGAMPFECEVCLKSFPYTRFLIAHKKKMHPEIFSNVPINHECEICQKKFAHKKSLVLHLRAHSGENAVLCDMCGKSLSSSEHLKQHLRIHTGYKPHCCSVCGKGFAKKCNLTLHERVHSGEKPHICNVCGKGFSQRSTLVIHGRYHSGERPYRCQLCHKGFVAKGLLGVHMKTCVGVLD